MTEGFYFIKELSARRYWRFFGTDVFKMEILSVRYHSDLHDMLLTVYHGYKKETVQLLFLGGSAAISSLDHEQLSTFKCNEVDYEKGVDCLFFSGRNNS